METRKRHDLVVRFSLLASLTLLFAGCERTEVPTAADNLAQSRGQSAQSYGFDHVRRGDNFRGRGFHFLSMSDAGMDAQGVNHRILMTGTGRFNRRNVVGGGFYNHFNIASAVPQTLLAVGTWRAERVISFSETDHPENPWGFNLSGVLEIEVRLFPVGGRRRGIRAVLTIVCNIPPAGILTGLPEGYFLDVGELNFRPAMFPGGFPFGVTSFSVNLGNNDRDHDDG